MALFSVCSVYEACRLVCLLYLFIYCVAWRGVACSVYGALGWGPCGVHSVWSVYEAFWAGRLFVAFRVFVTFMGHWGGTLVAFTVFLLSMECWGWTFCGFHSTCNVYKAFGLVLLVAFRVLVVFMGD